MAHFLSTLLFQVIYIKFEVFHHQPTFTVLGKIEVKF